MEFPKKRKEKKIERGERRRVNLLELEAPRKSQGRKALTQQYLIVSDWAISPEGQS